MCVGCVIIMEYSHKFGTSCVYNHKHKLGRMWIYNFAGESEFRLLLQDAKGLES